MGSSEESATRLWIGGSPCSGKSTVAARLSALRGWPLYTCDDCWEDHATLATVGGLPVLTKLRTLPIELRLRQPVGVQVADVLEAYREEFGMVCADLPVAGVVVEGAALLPEMLARIGVDADLAVWLVPTEEFQRLHYAGRDWARELLAAFPDADALFEAWMQRDAAFGRLVATQALDLGYRVIMVDGSRSADEVFGEVTAILR